VPLIDADGRVLLAPSPVTFSVYPPGHACLLLPSNKRSLERDSLPLEASGCL